MTRRRQVTIAGAIAIAVATAALAWAYFVTPITLPAPRQVDREPGISRTDFVGAERCASCHATQYAMWRASTHGRAGGPPSRETVIAPFTGGAIVFANARVTPRVRGRVYEFAIDRRGEPPMILTVDGVIGGGHIYGGGTQGYVSNVADGTVRFLPFEWSRHASAWFCNTNSRSGRGWAPITPSTRLEECGDWPPVRVLGDHPRFANCQSCHASQASLTLDTIAHRYETRFTSLAINCESCHGPARRHVELAERGAVGQQADIGLSPLATLDKDASSRVCYQCHAVKDRLRDGFVSGEKLETYYSTKFPLLGDRPLTPDGRVRTFAYQEGQQYSDCYLNGGMTCVSCHDPHDQRYRDINGVSLPGRFDDRQCTSCHAGKTDDPPAHTKHKAGSTACTSCHMPLRQEPETRSASAATRVVAYARSDHTISIPRPALDSALGLVSACATCHVGTSAADQERQIHAWWGELKPLHPAVAAQLRPMAGSDSDALALLQPRGSSDADPHGYARFAGVARFLEQYVRADAGFADTVALRLRALSRLSDQDLRAAALAARHLADGGTRSTRRTLASALRVEGDSDAGLRDRWAVILGFMGDRSVASGDLQGAMTAYTRALDIRPTNARVLLSRANTQRDAGDFAGALASYQRSLSFERNSPLAWVNFGIALAAAGDTSSAITALDNAGTLDPGEPLAWFNLGNIAFVRGDVARAMALYERTARLDPSIAPAHFQLARISLLRKDLRAALRSLRRGLAFDSSDASARQMAADLGRRLGSGTGSH